METTTSQMQYRSLGKTGLKVSAIGYGLMSVKEQELMTNLIKTAYEHGVNHFDTAEYYDCGACEILLGKALKDAAIPREDVVISTKVLFSTKSPKIPNTAQTRNIPFVGDCNVNSIGLSRKHVIEGTKASLKRLGLDYVDLIYGARPDESTPLEETCRAFDFVINQGWALYWGTSNWPAKKIRQAIGICEQYGLIKPVVEQVKYNMVERETMEREFVELFEDYGLGTTIWSPLAQGILAGKYNNGIPANSRLDQQKSIGWTDPLLAEDKYENTKKMLLAIDETAKSIGCSMSQLALCWIIKNNDVSSVLVGTTTVEQVKENLQAVKYLEKLTPEILEKLEKILGNKPQLGYDFVSGTMKKGRRD